MAPRAVLPRVLRFEFLGMSKSINRCFIRFNREAMHSTVIHRIQPVKRRRALLESNSPRNSRLQTHQDDAFRGEARQPKL
jgi:hypothetical protein